ncbi:MAG: YcaO-like family protein [Hyphomicrobiaceae bacterium]|nr:YcaO-like family protein [Hyphomicrobiaceae bacterium]MCC0022652.1 YcaO-like family protein [Hyphomicrobiaceae bacterium]
MTETRARTQISSRSSARQYSDRARSPLQTYELVRPYFDQFGITRVADQTALDRLGVPVFAAIRPNALSLSMSQGKGITDDDARISAVMEAIEVAIAEAPLCDIQSGFAGELRERPADVSYLMPPADSRTGERSSTAGNDLWVGASSFFTGDPFLIPLDAVCMRGRALRLKGISQNTNGLASGNSYEEAGFHAICELIERDALTFWSATPTPAKMTRRVDPACLDDQVVTELCAAMMQSGLDVALFDLTQDIGVASFAAYVGPADSNLARHSEFATGSGTHPDPARAAIRALTEAAQSRVTLIASARDDISAAVFKKDALRDVKALLAAPIGHSRFTAGQNPPETIQDLRKYLRDALNAAEVGDIHVARLDSREMPFAVVKAFAPRLESHGVNPNWLPGGRLKRRTGIAA